MSADHSVLLSPRRINGYCVDFLCESSLTKSGGSLVLDSSNACEGSASPACISSPGTPRSIPGGYVFSSGNEFVSPEFQSKSKRERGRPRSEILSSLSKEGSLHNNGIKCSFCQRLFPREKSLQAHMRTHTG